MVSSSGLTGIVHELDELRDLLGACLIEQGEQRGRTRTIDASQRLEALERWREGSALVFDDQRVADRELGHSLATACAACVQYVGLATDPRASSATTLRDIARRLIRVGGAVAVATYHDGVPRYRVAEPMQRLVALAERSLRWRRCFDVENQRHAGARAEAQCDAAAARRCVQPTAQLWAPLARS